MEEYSFIPLRHKLWVLESDYFFQEPRTRNGFQKSSCALIVFVDFLHEASSGVLILALGAGKYSCLTAP